MPDRTVLDLFRYDVEAPRREHYSHWYPGGRTTFSTEDFLFHTSSLADALAELGVGRGDRVALASDNRPEWHMTDLAVLDLGAVDVPLYPALTAEQLLYQLRDSGAVVAVVEDAVQAAKLAEVRGGCPELRHVVQIDGPPEDGVVLFSQLTEGGDAIGSEKRFWDRATQLDPDSLMTIIYTSGTTGEPKGVMLSHDNMVQNVLHSAHRVPVRRDDVVLEFLPLCHVLERMVGYIYMWRATTKAYCSMIHIGELIAEVRPTLFTGVPRFFEKVREAVLERVAAAPATRQVLYRRAIDIGRQAALRRLAGKPVDGMLAARLELADRLVLSRIREGLGGRVRFCVSGGAELPLPVNEFFLAVGITVVEGYGLTETSPVIAVNGADPGMLRPGTVGKPLDNLEVRLAPDGELLVRGASVMQGYWNKEQATAEAFDDEGFFRTGDIAEIDDDGFLLIVDRKKDLIVTAGGKNVAPQPLEAQLARSPLIDTAVLIGDHRPFIVALISPNFEALERWAADAGVDFAGRDDLVELPKVRHLYEEIVGGLNGALARYEQIKKFRLLPTKLSVDDGHLTPTLKVKRRVIEARFGHLIEAMYGR